MSAHNLDQHIDQLVHERFAQPQHIAVAYRAAKNAAEDVAAPLVGEVHALRQQKCRGSQVVGDNAVARTALVDVGFADHLFDGTDDRHKELGVVVAQFPLFDRHDALKAHTGIDGRLGQRRKVALFVAFVLHKDEVPDLQEPVAVAAHVILGTVEVLFTLVVKDLAARSARSGVAHLPEVVLVTHAQNAVAGDIFGPDLLRFVIALVHRYPELLDRKLKHFGHELPRIGDRIFFEVIAETEVSEHLEEGVVACRMADVFKVVVLAACTDTCLAARRPRRVRSGHFAGKNAFKRHHAGIGKKKRRVVGNQWRTLVNLMPLGGEKIQKSLSNIHRSITLKKILIRFYPNFNEKTGNRRFRSALKESYEKSIRLCDHALFSDVSRHGHG